MPDNPIYSFNNSMAYSSEELVSIFRQLSDKILILDAYSSNDFKVLSNRIRGYYKQATTIFEILSQMSLIISNRDSLSKQAQKSLKDISTIITKLQFHDIIRQKLEHIQKTNQDIVDELLMIQADQVNNSNGESNKYIPIIPDIARLHAAQLTHTNLEYQNAFADIKNNLQSIQNNTGTVSAFCLTFFQLLEKEQLLDTYTQNQSEQIIKLADNLSKEIAGSLEEIRHCESFEKLVAEINQRLITVFPDPHAQHENPHSREKSAVLRHLRESYTMESERVVHDQVFDSNNSPDTRTDQPKVDNNLELF